MRHRCSLVFLDHELVRPIPVGADAQSACPTLPPPPQLAVKVTVKVTVKPLSPTCLPVPAGDGEAERDVLGGTLRVAPVGVPAEHAMITIYVLGSGSRGNS
jgi:hypothetical protein